MNGGGHDEDLRAVRKTSRISVHCRFCYFGDGTLAHGTMWDLSETGWRATGTHPIEAGTKTSVTITIKAGAQSRNILIDEAVVRWSKGRNTGWQVITIDPASRELLMKFMEQSKTTLSPAEGTQEIRWY